MTLRGPRGILFDFGKTLLRDEPMDVLSGVEAVLAEATDRAGCGATEIADAIEDLLEDLEPRRYASQLEFPPTMTRRLVYEPRGIQFETPDEDLEWLFWKAATTWTLEPGVREALDAVATAGLPSGVVSNTAFRGQTLARQLAAYGLDGFSWIMASADYVVRKPHPLLFRLAAQRLGVPRESIWFVGDSFENDVEGAAAAGMIPIWYRPSSHDVPSAAPAAAVVASWNEFEGILQAALRDR